MNFNVGEKVIYNGKMKEYHGTDVEIIEAKSYWDPDDRRVKTFDGKNIFAKTAELMTYEEYYLLKEFEKVLGEGEMPPPFHGRCVCGARYTSFPNYHLDWCTQYRRPE